MIIKRSKGFSYLYQGNIGGFDFNFPPNGTEKHLSTIHDHLCSKTQHNLAQWEGEEEEEEEESVPAE